MAAGREAQATRDARLRELAHVAGLDRLSIFVPAVMSVGLVFWSLNELRDLARAQRERERDKRARTVARTIADRIISPPQQASPEVLGFRPRPAYLVLALGLLAGAAYVAVGSTANYARADGYASDIAWLLAVALAISLIGAFYGVAALVAFADYPHDGAFLRRALLGSPLTVTPSPPGRYPGRPRRRTVIALVAAVTAAALVSLAVLWLPDVLRDADKSVTTWLANRRVGDVLGWLDPVGRTEIAVALAGLAGLAAMRCRVLASGYLLSVTAGLIVSVTVRPLVARPRPPFGRFAGSLDSYPSGHILLATVMAGLLPLALAVLFGRRWIVRPLRWVLGVGVLVAAIDRVADGIHWPSDALGGVLIGLTLVLLTQLAIDTEASHRRCRHCPWSAEADQPDAVGVIPMHVDTATAVRAAAHVTAALAAVGLAVLAFTLDVPTNPEGTAFGRAVERPVQLGLAGFVSLAALVSWRWQAAGAVMIAFAATGLGIFASVEYRPEYAVALAALLLVPAVLLWLSWQHRRRRGEITAVAVATAVLLGATWAGAGATYDRYFGPTHPASSAAGVPVDRVEWVWVGGLGPDTITVTARLAEGRTSGALVARAAGSDEERRSTDAPAGEHRIVRLRLDGLRSNTRYDYRVVVDGVEDTGRGRGSFRTPGVGAFSFRFAVASCARTGSNGAVYDAIRAEDPLFYLELGDIHYENLEAVEPGPFLDAYDRVLTRPAQAALARRVPMAYVWDDHDYGPNDADASSPGRPAVRAAYRLAVPHYAVAPGDAPINQAFTIGRVRFVLTDGRSERTDATLLGERQEEWLIDEITAASRTHALVVWANEVPWISAAQPGADTWAGYAAERTRIADALADAGVTNLAMVSGDAHMVAIDDGTNSDYSSAQVGGFPVLQAAALDRPGSVKGGPYSEGAYPGGGQYGVVEIEDDGGDTIGVTLRGRTWDGRTLVELERTFTVPGR